MAYSLVAETMLEGAAATRAVDRQARVMAPKIVQVPATFAWRLRFIPAGSHEPKLLLANCPMG